MHIASGHADISVTGYTDPSQLRGVSFGVLHFASLGAEVGPLDTGSVNIVTHTNPKGGRTIITLFASPGGVGTRGIMRFKPAVSGGLAGLKNNYANSGTSTPYPYE